jgi:hypothetical protein
VRDLRKVISVESPDLAAEYFPEINAFKGIDLLHKYLYKAFERKAK